MKKKYDVYAIGNALVDYEFMVTDDILKQYHIEKNLMTLIDETHANHLLESLSGHFDNKALGGSAANALSTFVQLGGRAFLSCRVAHDANGKFYQDDLKNTKIDSNIHLRELNSGRTGICLVLLTPDAERTMLTSLGITQTMDESDIVAEAIAESEWLFIEGYLAAVPSTVNAVLHAIEIARKNKTKLALTLSDPNMLILF